MFLKAMKFSLFCYERFACAALPLVQRRVFYDKVSVLTSPENQYISEISRVRDGVYALERDLKLFLVRDMSLVLHCFSG